MLRARITHGSHTIKTLAGFDPCTRNDDCEVLVGGGDLVGVRRKLGGGGERGGGVSGGGHLCAAMRRARCAGK